MLNQPLTEELKQESASTKKMLQRIPEDQFGWKPHQKSRTLGQLASHVADLPAFLNSILTLDVLDFAKGDYKPYDTKTQGELMNLFQEKLDEVLETLQNTSDEQMQAGFTIRNGDYIIATLPRIIAVRSAINHIVHHRGQLSVYLRLLDIPVPGMYGPSADEM